MIPLYLFVIEKIVAELEICDFADLDQGIEKIAKQRDEVVSRMFKIMQFLATVLLLVFVIEMGAVSLNGLKIFTVEIKVDREGLLFGLLLIGNLIALLFVSAMMKMFMLEFLIKTYLHIKEDGAGRFISSISYRMYVFTFGHISEQGNFGLPKPVVISSRVIHVATIVILPISYITIYLVILAIAMTIFCKSAKTSYLILNTSIDMWYFYLLLLFNILTLSLYAFVFFPCRRPQLEAGLMAVKIADRAFSLWSGAGRPEGRDEEIWLLAERQIHTRYRVKPPLVASKARIVERDRLDTVTSG